MRYSLTMYYGISCIPSFKEIESNEVSLIGSSLSERTTIEYFLEACLDAPDLPV